MGNRFDKGRVVRQLTRVLLLSLLLLAGWSGLALDVTAQSSPEQQLADRFAPVAQLRVQSANCDRDGEGYFPAPVDTVLGNPEITLKQHGEDGGADTVVTTAPTAQDLAGKDDSYYLDIPGNPRHPGCNYETLFKRYAAEQGTVPSTYARIFIDDENDALVLQYWFWYLFNDWNNTHESDWEMVQIQFDTTSVTEALAGEPSRVGFAQHGGGETANWEDTKLRREGDRLIVFPAAGSHGTYFNNDIWIGWGENGTGFGCDNSSTRSTATPLNAILVPQEIDTGSPFAWLTFEGRWGERQPWEFNGPTGPKMKDQWGDPVGTMDDWRESSLSAPGGRGTALGPSATDVFCNISKYGSQVFMEIGSNPTLLLGLVAAVLAVAVFIFTNKRRTIRDAYAFYLRHIRVFMPIGLISLPIGIAFNIIQIILRSVPPFDWLIAWFDDTAAARLIASAAAGSLQHIILTLLIAPPVIQTVLDVRRGLKPDLRRSYRQAYQHLSVLAVALVLATAAGSLLSLTIIGIPIASILGIRWQFFGQATILDGADTGREALGKSRRAITGRTVQAISDSLIFQLLAIIPGPLVGAILMVAGKASVDFANLFASVVYAITLPISTIGLTLVYIRYRDRDAPEQAAVAHYAGDVAPEPGTAPA
jgi:hypothetical protein